MTTVDQRPASVELPDGTRLVPERPPIAGLRFRRWAGAEDIAGYVAVVNAASLADDEPDFTTPERATVEMDNLSHSDIDRDVLVADVDGRMVAWSRVFWEDDNAGGRAYTAYGYVHPDWRRHGLGTAMLAHDERRLREIAIGHGDVGPTWLSSWAPDHDVGNRQLMLGAGYREDRYFYLMVRPDLDDVAVPPVPQGLELRPLRDQDTRPFWAAMSEAFRDHWGGVDDTEEAYQSWRKDPLFDLAMYVVAWDGDQIAGAVVNGIDPTENEALGTQRGWLHSVFTRRPWRQRGLAGALVARSLVLLRERGMTSAQLGVDTQNPHAALTLYERAGFRPANRATAWRKEWDLSGTPRQG